MIKVENIEVFNFDGAIRGMRNPLQSWSKSDSDYEPANFCDSTIIIGDADMDLMQRLFRAGTEHRKYLRQIGVCMDIVSNHTFWSEFDTYKVGITRNSCSKMHTIHVKEFTADDFSHEGIDEVGGATLEHFNNTINILETLRKRFNETHEKKYWRAIIDLLPMGYNLRSTITMNYENVVNIIRQRSGHKMFEWNQFVEILKDLPHIREIMEGDDRNKARINKNDGGYTIEIEVSKDVYQNAGRILLTQMHSNYGTLYYPDGGGDECGDNN